MNNCNNEEEASEARYMRKCYKGMMNYKLLTFISLCLFSAIYGLYLFWIGRYAFGFDDAKNCYFIDELDTPGTSQLDAEQKALALQIPIKPGYPINMAHIFRAWFLWGFWDAIF